MPIGIGYVGLGKESTFGTAVAPNVFLPVASAEVNVDPQFYYPDQIRGSRAQNKAIATGLKVDGGLEMDADAAMVGHLLLAALGSVSTTAASGVNTHVFSPANTLPSYTLEKYDGTMIQRTSGLKADKLSLTIDASGDGVLKSSLDFMAQGVTDQASQTSTSYTDKVPFAFTNAQFYKGGSVNNNVKNFTVEIGNNLKDDGYTLRQSNQVSQITEGMREVSGSVSMYFKTKADYTSFVSGTKDSLKLVLTGGLISGASYETLTIELPNVQYDAFAVPMGGADDEVMANIDFTALYDSTLTMEIKATLVNGVTGY
jgi:hypothetical protein